MINSFKGQNDFLSNFHICIIKHQGLIYKSVEHAYQALKTLDMSERRKMQWMGAGEAKKYGKTLKLRPNWEEEKVIIMASLLVEKFKDHSLRNKLIATYPNQLVEGNYWHDNFWGNCTCEKCANKTKYNVLGVLLMKIREDLYKKYPPKKKEDTSIVDDVDFPLEEDESPY